MTDFNDETAEVERQYREREKRDEEDIRHVMSDAQGRRIVWKILEQANVFGPCFATDPYVTAFKEGQRNLALALFQRVMSCCPELYLTMADEARKQDEKR